jgi:L-2,4-diaminobutyric acid acetyltransferase
MTVRAQAVPAVSSAVASSVASCPVSSYRMRAPVRADGAAIHALVAACPPLDLNSVYAYLLLCEHFSATCIVAESVNGEIDGFVSAYRPPERPDVLFVWQVAVHGRARGQGLAVDMLAQLLQRLAQRKSRPSGIETTVGPDNAASRRSFQKLARLYGATVREQALFEAHLFGDGAHEDERLLQIGPLAYPAIAG